MILSLFDYSGAWPEPYLPETRVAGFADNPYTDTYSKFTQLWGTFNKQLPRWPLAPTIVRSGGKLGSLHWAGRGGTRLSTKNARSKTPQGFARAFAKANPYA